MDACRPKPSLPDRPLIGSSEAERLGWLFKSLAHPSRLRLLHALIRAGELNVSDLASEVGMTTQAVSNQLQRLAAISVVCGRRDGLQIIYRVIDPCVPVLLERGWCHIDEFDEGAAIARPLEEVTGAGDRSAIDSDATGGRRSPPHGSFKLNGV